MKRNRFLVVSCLAGAMLAHAKRGWSFSNDPVATLVLGQSDFVSGLANPGGVTANSLNGPRRFWTDGTRLAVSDTNNNRVLLWNSLPTVNGQAADLVLGQPDFISNAGNQGGTVSAATLDMPHGIVFDGTRLWVADMGNNRVLWYNGWPTVNDQAANGVLGQADLVSNAAQRGGAVSALGLYWPCGIDTNGSQLVIGDTFNNRVLIYNSVPTTNGAAPDVVVGQPNFSTNSTGACTPTGINYVHDVRLVGGKLIFGDTNNSRYLIYNSVPTTNGAAADVAVGVPNTSSCGSLSGGGGQASTSWAVGFDVDAGGALWIADYGNNRVLRFPTVPSVSGAAADLVVGQADFLGYAANQGGTISASTLNAPYHVSYAADRLFVADSMNNRLLIYVDPSPPTPTPSPIPTPVPWGPGPGQRLHCGPSYILGGGGSIGIDIRSASGGACRVRILRNSGRRLTHLWSGNLQAGATLHLAWDGKADNGESLASGVYYVAFTDGDGAVSVQKVLIVR